MLTRCFAIAVAILPHVAPAAIVAAQFDSLKFTAVSASGEFACGVIAAGTSITCGMTATGALRCWGGNERGQPGIRTPQPPSARQAPTPPSDTGRHGASLN